MDQTLPTTHAAHQRGFVPAHSSGLAGRFSLLLTSTFVSGIGDGIVFVAAPLLASGMTNNAIVVSGLTAAATLPWLLVGIQAGIVADRSDRRRLMLTVEAFRAVVTAYMALAVWQGWWPILTLYVGLLLLGFAEPFFTASGTAELPCMVPDGSLAKANGRMMAAEVASQVTAGRALGGVLIGASWSLPFALDSLTFALSAVLLTFAISPRARVTSVATSATPPMSRAVVEALRSFRNDRALRLLAVITTVFAGCQAMTIAPFVLFAKREVGLDERGVGLLLGLSAASGIVGGLAAGWAERRLGAIRAILGAALLTGLAYIATGLAPRTAVVFVALLVESLVVVIANASSVTLRQRLIPSDRLGTSGNIVRLCIFGVVPLAAVLGGILAQTVSLRTPQFVAGATQLLVLPILGKRLVTAVRERRAGHCASPDERTPSAAPAGPAEPMDASGPLPRPHGLPLPTPRPRRARYTGEWLADRTGETMRPPNGAHPDDQA